MQPASDNPRDEAGHRYGDDLARGFAERFAGALEEGDAHSAESIVAEALEANLEVEQIYDQVIGPGLVRIGHLWQSGEASIADEHLATAISQQVMAGLFPKVLRGTKQDQKRIMLAGPAGEDHVLGLRMIADTLEGAGHEVIYLGGDVPSDALVDACRKHRPAAVGLTAATPSTVPAAVEDIEAILQLEEPPAIFVGGRALEQARGLGVDVTAANSCEEVVEFVANLVENPDLPGEVRQRLDFGYAEWQEKSPVLVEHEADPDPDVSELGMASAFSNSALMAAESAREAARDAFELKELAYRDGLTGLWNRRAYDDRLRELTDRGTPGGSVLMLDIDRFKEVNDTYGHEAGDEALIGVGRAILRTIRPLDFGARFGGDEFVVLMPEMDLEAATGVAERIRSTIKKEQRHPPVTVSIGASSLDEDPRASSLAMDQALYGAKRAGRDRVVST